MDEWQADTTTCYAVDTLAVTPSPLPLEGRDYVEAIPLAREGLDLGFIPGTLLCVVVYFVLLVAVQLHGRGLLAALFFKFFRERNTEQLVTKKILPNPFPLLCSLVLSFISLSLFIVYIVHGKLMPGDTLLYLASLIVYHFLLLGVITLLGWIFDARACARELTIDLWIYNAVPGIILSPAVFSLFYTRSFAAVLLPGIVFLFLAYYAVRRLVQWAKILFKHGVPIFYLILYLCALELLPLLVLYKMLAGSS